jgi:dGTPase
MNVPDVSKQRRVVAAFLLQLARRALLRRLAFLKSSRNNFEHFALNGLAKLPDEDKSAVTKPRKNRNRSAMADNLAICPGSILQFHFLDFKIQKSTSEYRLDAQCLLKHSNDAFRSPFAPSELVLFPTGMKSIIGGMIHSRKEREKLEERHLASWAARSAGSRGRKYDEVPHGYRSEFQRDRDRILHSRSFRRLEYKTQVFVNGTADHYRTRLTHTMEMAAVGRTIARALRANEDLTEAIALAHDIGHSPFGHVGEYALDELMRNEGGFDHNIQSCRAVEMIEQRYPSFPGLNLTWEVRAGLRKHQAATPGAELDGLAIGPFQYIEAQIADIADDMTYHAHDVDDAFEAGLITVAQLSEQALWREAVRRAKSHYANLQDEDLTAVTIRCLLDMQVEDVLQTSSSLLDQHNPQSPEDVMASGRRLVAFSPEMKALLEPFRAFLYRDVYYHSAVSQSSGEAVAMMRKLFLFYIDNPETMGRKARRRLPAEGLWRTVCDYIAGMTDRYAIEEFQKFGLQSA